MSTNAVIAIFDIGKTNKKLFLIDEQYRIVWEKAEQLKETNDEDGDACEDINELTKWVRKSLDEAISVKEVNIKAINFSAYGASFVHLNSKGKPTAPLYNYLKPFPDQLSQSFYHQYGDETSFSLATASPVLGNLNAGLQLYYIKHLKPSVFKEIQYSLHLPQYISYLLTGRPYSDITSIGCHTALWDFRQNRYHEWLFKEEIDKKMAAIFPSDQLMKCNWQGKPLLCGAGLHDSSAALIPYSTAFKVPFVLISTGTWCISLNPFNQQLLTKEELQQDCLCYMEYRGKPIKASRLFAGFEHEQQLKRIASHFNLSEAYFNDIGFDKTIVNNLLQDKIDSNNNGVVKQMMQQSTFALRNLNQYSTASEAYHQLIIDIMKQQSASTQLVLNNSDVKKIFVDGGFGKNDIYMHLLAGSFPKLEVYAASVAQASAIGAALAVQHYWNKGEHSAPFTELRRYHSPEYVII